MGAAAAAYGGTGTLSGNASASGFFTDLRGAIKDSIIGGVRSGLSKRLDAQIGGHKAAIYGGSPAGALQVADHRATSQLASQGQEFSAAQAEQAQQGYFQFLEQMAEADFTRQRRLMGYQHLLNKDMVTHTYSLNGDTANGQYPILPLGTDGHSIYDQIVDPVGTGYDKRQKTARAQGRRNSKLLFPNLPGTM